MLDCSNSITYALELLQSCTKSSICKKAITKHSKTKQSANHGHNSKYALYIMHLYVMLPYIDSLVEYCSISRALAMEILQIKPQIGTRYRPYDENLSLYDENSFSSQCRIMWKYWIYEILVKYISSICTIIELVWAKYGPDVTIAWTVILSRKSRLRLWYIAVQSAEYNRAT